MKKHLSVSVLFFFINIVISDAQSVIIPDANQVLLACPPFLNYTTLGSTLNFSANGSTGTAYYPSPPPNGATGEEKVIRFTPAVTGVYDFVYSDNFTPAFSTFNNFHYRLMNAVCDIINYDSPLYYYPTQVNNITYWHYTILLTGGTTYEMLVQPWDPFIPGSTSVIIDCFTPQIVSNGKGICPGGSVQLSIANTLNPLPGVNYQWKLNGANIQGATQSSYAATIAGTYTCTATGACGVKTSSAYIVQSANVPAAPVVSGSTGFCRPSTGNIYEVESQSGLTYNWTTSTGATITSGQNSSITTVSFAANAGNVNICATAANYCGSSAAGCKAVIPRTSNPSNPGTISGQNYGCSNNAKLYTIRKVANADGYLWTPPAGTTINGSSNTVLRTDTFAYVLFTAAFTGDTLRVRSVNCNGMSSSERKLRINKKNPATPGLITGATTGLCNQSANNYFIAPVDNTLNYTWRTNIAGATINGSASPVTVNGIAVTLNFGTFTTGQIYVKANNGCGSSAERSLTVNAKPAVPSIINGPVSVCDGQLGVAYSTSAVTNASAYNWTVPPGATVASGQNTTAITVNFGANPATGNVRVRSQNACASSAYLTKSVTINNCPRLPKKEISTIEIRPNPCNQTAVISIPEDNNTTDYTLFIYDFLGREVYALSAPGKEISVNRSILKTGIYTVVLKHLNELIATERMMVE